MFIVFLLQDNVRMLLDVAAELPNNELLLQKHFTALLSSVWRINTSSECQHSLRPTKDGSYYGKRLLGSRVNHSSKFSISDSRTRVNMTNLTHSRKLLASALHDVTSKPVETGGRPDRGEEASPVGDGLEVILEFHHEKDDVIPLPSVLELSIPGPDLPPCESKSTENNPLKSSRSMAESRFRYRVCYFKL